MWTSDFKRALGAPGDARGCGAGLLLNVKGKPVTYGVFLAKGPEDFLISVVGGTGEAARQALDHLLVADDVELALLTSVPFRTIALPEGFPGRDPLPELLAIAPDARDRVFAAQAETFGWRLPRAQLGPRHEEIWLELGHEVPFATQEMGEGEWVERRIAAGVPEFGVDYDAENLVLEFPFHDEISFHKGCYIGQEVVARGTYRGRMNRGFARFTGEGPLRPGLVHSESEPEKPVAKLTSVSADRGLGLVRLASLEPGADGRPPGRLFQPTPTPVLVRSVEVIP